MWEPLDFDNLTDEQKRLGDHPEVAWILIALMLIPAIISWF